MSKDELKPCPFCGSEANIASVKYSPESSTAKLNKRTIGYYGQCIRCSANLCFGIADPTKDLARGRWNTRHAAAENTELQEKIDRLTGKGIEDMKHEITELEAQLALHEWVSVEDGRKPVVTGEVGLITGQVKSDKVALTDGYRWSWGYWYEDEGQWGCEIDIIPTYWRLISLPAQGKDQAEAEKCEWKRNEPGNFYETSCGKTWPRYVTDDYLCPFCGLEIKEVE